MNNHEMKPVDVPPQLFEFMLQMPQMYGDQQDHMTHAERQALAQGQKLSPEEAVK